MEENFPPINREKTHKETRWENENDLASKEALVHSTLAHINGGNGMKALCITHRRMNEGTPAQDICRTEFRINRYLLNYNYGN
ncbi:unnamed protein product [Allacma fusca]|uniref:Uncharacterized protein n=1 Tax=Allacma fusca TaxID=39272 RepID=A0A8J2PT95_9HEXA|nr:unnamed protein product [Allacma fusca]